MTAEDVAHAKRLLRQEKPKAPPFHFFMDWLRSQVYWISPKRKITTLNAIVGAIYQLTHAVTDSGNREGYRLEGVLAGINMNLSYIACHLRTGVLAMEQHQYKEPGQYNYDAYDNMAYATGAEGVEE